MTRELLGELGDGISVCRAVADDIPAIVELLAADDLGRGRESDPSDPLYRKAFQVVVEDSRQLLTVILNGKDQVIGTLQLVMIPGLSRAGSTRGVIEAVRVASGERGSGLGTRYVRWAVDEARLRGASMVQLTSDLRRTDAHRFYERLGFVGSHLGMKLEFS